MRITGMCFARSRGALAACLLAAVFCALSAACGASAESLGGDSPYSPTQIAEVILATQPARPALYALTPESADFSFRLTDAYAVDPDGLEDGVICSPAGFEANEITVLLFEDGEAAADAAGALDVYRQSRADTYVGYAPEQSALAEGGDVVVSGRCVALLICENDEARSAFLACFDETPPALPETPRLTAPPTTVAVATTVSSAAASVTTSATVSAATTDASSAVTSAPTASKAVLPTSAAPALTSAATSVTSVAAGAITTGAPPTSATAPATAVSPATAPATGANTEPTVATASAASTAPVTATAASQPTAAVSASAASTSTATAASTVPSATASEPPSTPATAEDRYDPAAILNAWHTGDHSSLSDKNLTVLLMCLDVIDREISDEMTAYERELTIHDWIIGWAEYDWAEDSQDPNDEPSPDHDNPYGLLVHRKAICSGYSSTFQLFMDMLGIECATVNGLANMTREEHAWNLVRLDDGEWYCVDVTWDDPFGESSYGAAKTHRYFNVTSQFLRDTFHFWDEETVPECTAVFYAWTE